jgi:hypothetical protein
MNTNGDAARRVTEAVLAFPHLAAKDRSELESVLRAIDHDERVFGPESETPEILYLLAKRQRDLLHTVDTIATRYAS